MSKHVMPFLVVNYGCEMMFVLGVRLEAQLIEPTKSKRIKCDIINSMFSSAFMDELFRPQNIYTNGALRKVFTTVSDSSIMKLSEVSMMKLYELMTMTVKYQVLSLHHPYELLDYTANHLDELKRMSPADVHPLIDSVLERMHRLSASLSLGEMADVRYSILNFALHRRIKVSLFLERHMQLADGNFILPRATLLPPVANTEAPGVITYHSGAAQGSVTTFPHRDAGLTLPLTIAVGHWGPQHFGAGAHRVTTSGENLYRSHGSKDMLAAQCREVPDRARGNGAALGSVAAAAPPQQATAEQLQAYHNEMSYLSQLAGNHTQPQEKIRLSLFEDEEVYGDSQSLSVPPPPPVTAAAPSSALPQKPPPQQQQQQPAPTAPSATPSLRTSPVDEGKSSSMVKISKMDAGAVRQENHQLLGIINALDERTGNPSSMVPPPAQQNNDDLLDIMDEI